MRTRRDTLLILSSLIAVQNTAVGGAWSHESFGNDGALDWVSEFQEKPTREFLQRTLSQGTTGKYLDSFAGEGIIAASEVVAASLGRPSSDFPKDLVSLLAKSGAQFKTLAPLARSALANGVLGAKSELRENWSLHAEDLSRWKSSVNALLKRL